MRVVAMLRHGRALVYDHGFEICMIWLKLIGTAE
jgi:hypothetical protein